MTEPDIKPDEWQNQPRKRKWAQKRKWGRTILIVSLAANLLFVGAIVGAGWMRHNHHSGKWQGPPDFVVKRLLRHFPADKQRAIFEQIKLHRVTMRPKFKQIRSQKQELKRALHKEPFDAHVVRKAAASLKKIRQEFIDVKAELLVNVLEQLTPDERRQLLKSHLFRHLFRTRSRWGSRHP